MGTDAAQLPRESSLIFRRRGLACVLFRQGRISLATIEVRQSFVSRNVMGLKIQDRPEPSRPFGR